MRMVREVCEFSQIHAIRFGGLGFNLSISKSNLNFILVSITLFRLSIEHCITTRGLYNDMSGNTHRVSCGQT